MRTNWNGLADEVRDSSISGHHGVAENDAQTVDDGRVGRAGQFDGVDDAVNLGTIPRGNRPSANQGWNDHGLVQAGRRGRSLAADRG